MDGQIMVSRMERNSKKYKRKNRKYKIEVKTNDGGLYKIYSNEAQYSDYSDVLEFPSRMARRGREKKSKNYNNKEADKNSKVTNVIATSLMGATILYCGVGMYFKDHFLPNTKINDVDISFKSIDEAGSALSKNVENYSLNIIGRDNASEKISAKDINLIYDLKYDYELEKLKKNQKSVFWITSLFKDEDKYKAEIISYDEDSLNKIIDNFSILNQENIVEPKNAYLKYVDNEFTIVDEVPGNKINKDKLHECLVQSILSGEGKIDLENMDCYENPEFTSESKEMIKAKEEANKYSNFNLTYDLGSEKYVLQGDELLNLFSFDEDYNMHLDNTKAEKFINNLCEKYNTLGKAKSFTTSQKNTISISGGDYGISINKDSELNELINNINTNVSVERKPIYYKNAYKTGTGDIGDTYVEINIGRQHLWFYKNGQLVCDGDIVTGNTGNGHGTPDGVYTLKDKTKNTVLVGKNYRSPVSFWMPFNNGIGIHDASWRSVFGRDFYKTNGSHGCVNCPYLLAKSIYENIENGMPIVCYY